MTEQEEIQLALKLLNNIKVPEGYELTGEYRVPKYSEPYYHRRCIVHFGVANEGDYELILRKKEKPMPRAEIEGRYYYIEFNDDGLPVIEETFDVYCTEDDERYKKKNYFMTESDAQSFADKISALTLAMFAERKAE